MQHHFSFPETYTSPDGAEFVIRPLAVSDRDAFSAFFSALPERDKLFFQEDLSNPDQADRWLAGVEAGRTFALVAFSDEKVVGQVSLYRRLHGWTRLVGYVFVAVRPDRRGRGIAGYLLRRIVEIAVQMGLDKLVAETLTGQRRERRIIRPTASARGHPPRPRHGPARQQAQRRAPVAQRLRHVAPHGGHDPRQGVRGRAVGPASK